MARDLAIGRIYLPREDRIRFGYSESELRTRRVHAGIRASLMKFEVERARDLFAEGRALVARMPRALAIDVDLVLARWPGHPGCDRGERIRRPVRPPESDALDQASADCAAAAGPADGSIGRRLREANRTSGDGAGAMP